MMRRMNAIHSLLLTSLDAQSPSSRRSRAIEAEHFSALALAGDAAKRAPAPRFHALYLRRCRMASGYFSSATMLRVTPFSRAMRAPRPPPSQLCRTASWRCGDFRPSYFSRRGDARRWAHYYHEELRAHARRALLAHCSCRAGASRQLPRQTLARYRPVYRGQACIVLARPIFDISMPLSGMPHHDFMIFCEQLRRPLSVASAAHGAVHFATPAS